MKHIRQPLLQMLFVFLVAFGSHGASLRNGFVGDDFRLIAQNDFITDWHNARLVLSPDYFINPLPVESGARPLTILSLMADHRIWSGNRAGFHFTNLVVHGLNAALVFVLAAILVRGRQYGIPLVASLVFALHPVQSEVVNVASFRADLLVTLFYVLSMILFIVAGRHGRWRAIILYAASMTGFVCALVSKEMAITLPLVYMLYAGLFEKGNVRKAGMLLGLGSIILAAAYIAFFWSDRFGYDLYNAIYLNIKDGISPIASFRNYANTVFLSLFHYSKTIVIPVYLSFDYLMILPGTVFNIRFIVSAAMICAFFVIFYRSKDTVLKFGLGCALFAYLPVSNLYPLVNTIADRYLYLPMTGVSIVLSIVIFKLSAYKLKTIPVSILAAVLMLVSYGVASARRTTVFLGMSALYGDAVRKSPDNPRAHLNLAFAYTEGQNYDKALAEYNKVMELNPLYKRADVWFSMAVCHEKLGNRSEARDYYRKLLLLRPEKAAIKNYAVILWAEGREEEAMWFMKKSIELAPDADAYNKVGAYYAKHRGYEQATSYFEKSIALDPSLADAWLNLIHAYDAMNERKKADKKAAEMERIFRANGWVIEGRTSYAE